MIGRNHVFLILLNIVHLNSLRLLETRFYIGIFLRKHSRPNERSTLTDFIFTSDDQSIINLTYVSPLGKSHHEILNFNYLIKCSLNHGKLHYLYDAANSNIMKNDLCFTYLQSVLASCDTISCWERFLNAINPIISKYTPTQW